jgi:hypothetical protein
VHEVALVKQIDTVNPIEVLVWFADDRPRLRVSGASTKFTRIGIFINGQENTPSGWEDVLVHITEMTP